MTLKGRKLDVITEFREKVSGPCPLEKRDECGN